MTRSDVTRAASCVTVYASVREFYGGRFNELIRESVITFT